MRMESRLSVLKRTFNALVHVLGGVAAALTLLLAVTGWQLSKGPVSLGFLSPYIEDLVNSGKRSVNFQMGNTILTWAGWERTLDIRILDVKLITKSGNAIASVPEVSFALSGEALYEGHIAPKNIELFGPSLQIHRQADGKFSIDFQGSEDDDGKLSASVLSKLADETNPNIPMSFLSSIDVISAEVVVIDDRTNRVWRSPASDIRLRRKAGGLSVEGSLILESGQIQTEIDFAGAYVRADGHMSADIKFSEVPVEVLFPFARAFSSTEFKANFPIKGSLNLGMFVDGHIDSVGFDISGGKGTMPFPGQPNPLPLQHLTVKGSYKDNISLLQVDSLQIELQKDASFLIPEPINHTMPISNVDLKGSYQIKDKQLIISELLLDLHGVTVNAGLSLSNMGEVGQMIEGRVPYELSLKGSLEGLEAEELSRYWPASLGNDAYIWVTENVTKGSASDAWAEVKFVSDGAGKVQLEALDGGMKAKGVSVSYLKPMKPVVEADVDITFGKKVLDIRVLKGRSDGLELNIGQIILSGLDEIDQIADISLSVAGSLRDKLNYIDQKPLQLASLMSYEYKSAKGKAVTDVKLHFPVEHSLTLEKIQMSAVSHLENVSLGNVFLGKSISQGQLKLVVDKQGMEVSGTASIGKIPTLLSWRENFGKSKDFKSRYDVAARIKDIRHIEDIGLNLKPFSGDYIKGAVKANIRYTILDKVDSRLEVKADLTEARLDIATVEWTKPIGVPGTANIILNISNKLISDVPQFSIEAGDLSISGSAKYDLNGTGLERIDFDRIAYARTNMKGALIPTSDGGWDAGFSGASFDLSPMWEKVKPGGVTNQGEEPFLLPKLTLAIELDRVWVEQNKSIEAVSGTFAYKNGLWQTVVMNASFGQNADLKVEIKPEADGNRTFFLEAGDAGETFRFFDHYDSMKGGKLRIVGKYNDDIVGEPLTGILAVKDYRIIDAPALTQILSVMALTGIVDVLSGEGLGFTTLDVPFVSHEGTIKLNEARAFGASIGFTASGTIYSLAEVIDIKGTVIPAYALNSVFGRIPILGGILTGGEKGGGVFAANYSMSGPAESPAVEVNPLSALTPGFLRNLFGIIDGDQPPLDLLKEK